MLHDLVKKEFIEISLIEISISSVFFWVQFYVNNYIIIGPILIYYKKVYLSNDKATSKYILDAPIKNIMKPLKIQPGLLNIHLLIKYFN